MSVPVVSVPVVETERLVLREYRDADFDAYAAMVADPEVTRFLGDGKPLSRFDAWRQMAMFAGHWALRGFGVWAVEEKSTGNFIGRIGCLDPEGWPAFEIGYTLCRSAWGKGYATEGVTASLDYARNRLKRTEIVSIIRPDNHGSIRVAMKLGATPGRVVEFFGAPARLYEYPR